jgi:hypothetical protein
MSSYYYLFVITGITIETSPSKLSQSQPTLPPPFVEHFQLLGQREFTKTSPQLPDGTHLSWPKVDLYYGLSPKGLHLLSPFFKDIWQTIKNFPKPRRYDYFNNCIDDFMAQHWANITLTPTSLPSIDDDLQGIMTNYFIRYRHVPHYVVYSGWPEKLNPNKNFSAVSGFTLFHSYEKMGVIPEDTILLSNLHAHLVKQLAAKHPFIEYLYVMGF